MSAPGTGRRIIAEVAREHNITPADIIGRDKRKAYIAARFEAYKRVAEATRWSLPRLGRLFGRDHTTVLSAFRRIGFEYHSDDPCGRGWKAGAKDPTAAMNLPKGPAQRGTDGRFVSAGAAQ